MPGGNEEQDVYVVRHAPYREHRAAHFFGLIRNASVSRPLDLPAQNRLALCRRPHKMQINLSPRSPHELSPAREGGWLQATQRGTFHVLVIIRGAL